MSIIKNLILILFSFIIINHVNAEEVKKILKNKDWETYVIKNDSSKIVLLNQCQFYKLLKKIQEKQDFL